MQRSVPGIRFVLIAMVLFAFQDGISRHLAEHYPVPFFVMVRYWFFLIFVLALSARRKGGLRATARTRWPLLQFFRGVLLASQIVIIVIAFGRLGLGATQAIFAMQPLLATLLAVPLLGERIGPHRLAAILVGFAGMLVILRPGVDVFDPNAILALTATLMFALYAVLTRLVGREDGSSAPAFLYTGVGGAAVLTLIGPFYWAEPTLADWGWILVLSITGMSGHYFLIRAYEVTEAVRIQPFVYLQPMFAMIIGPVVFGEPSDIWIWVGAAMIVLAGLYALWRERLRLPSPASPSQDDRKPPSHAD